MSHTNHLRNESSPYLLQHAQNPVDWFPWGPEALQKALIEKKPILLSIGYSSCHWCHVMAHQCFENEEIAQLMNERFINIKLDREERPDIDNIYMDAIQAMGISGGWPLNVFITPDQKPFYGGTYFPPEQWTKLLTAVSDAYQSNHDQIYESASRFAETINRSEAEKYGLTYGASELSLNELQNACHQLEKRFDKEWGGLKKAPKFPMPSLWNFLLTYSVLSGDEGIRQHVLYTLDKMAAGGIYDHIAGGFARYSVDSQWHVPHFEKMLYDNGQLLELYAQAYKVTGNAQYKRIMTGIAGWLKHEMQDTDGGFYSALDADSEGEEGRYYVWSFDEVKQLAGPDFSVIADYYNVTEEGNWEEGKNVLRKLESTGVFARELNLSEEELQEILARFHERALTKRQLRPAPGLDYKKIAGWNALTLSGLCHSYQATGSSEFQKLAVQNAAFIRSHLIHEGILRRIHTHDTEGFLEDYAAVIQSFIDYYETFFDESFLQLAYELTERTIACFYAPDQNLFYYTSKDSENLIARKQELFDNVIPASNSIMAKNLYRMGLIFDQEDWRKIAEEMVLHVNKLIRQEIEYLSNWATASLIVMQPTPEIVIVGEDAYGMATDFHRPFIPNKILLSTSKKSNIPLFEFKQSIDNKTTIFVCYDKVCRHPVFETGLAMQEIHLIK